MRTLRLSTVGALCAVLTALAFVVAIAVTVSSGVPTLIPERGKSLDWIADVGGAGNAFFAGGWIVLFAGLLGVFALLGFYDALRAAGPVMVIAPIAGAVGLTLVTISQAIPLAMGYELVPAYTETANEASRAALAATSDTLASLSLLLNYFGNALGWGVAVPLYAIAILKTRIVPKWIGWLGMVVAVFAGWLGLLAPALGLIEGLTTIGFLAFFVFLASLGVALLLRERHAEAATAPGAPA
jgi:hypothetical protein